MDANSCINFPVGSRRKVVDRHYLAELRSELNERIDVEKDGNRAIHIEYLDHLSVCMGIYEEFECHQYVENSRKETETEKIFAQKLRNNYQESYSNLYHMANNRMLRACFNWIEELILT